MFLLRRTPSLKIVDGFYISEQNIATLIRDEVLLRKKELLYTANRKYIGNVVSLLSLHRKEHRRLIISSYLDEKYYSIDNPIEVIKKFVTEQTGYQLDEINVILGDQRKHAERIVLDDARGYFQTLDTESGPHIFNICCSSPPCASTFPHCAEFMAKHSIHFNVDMAKLKGRNSIQRMQDAIKCFPGAKELDEMPVFYDPHRPRPAS